MTDAKKKAEARIARHKRVRRTLSGTSDRPRLCVFRSSKHIYAQLYDDVAGQALATVSTLSKDLREAVAKKSKKEASRIVGLKLAEVAKEKGITSVRFDRGGFLYHGRVRALADAAREGGLEF